MQSVSAEQTQISLSPVPRTLCGDRDKKVQADTQNWLAGIGTPSASSLGAAVGGRPFLWLIVGLMPKKEPPGARRPEGWCIRLAHVDQFMRSDLLSCSRGPFRLDRWEHRPFRFGCPVPEGASSN